MTEEEMDRLLGYAETSYTKAMSGENVGLVAWTSRVQTALKFIPTLITIIDHLRTDLAQSRMKEGGHFDTVIVGNTVTTTCSTCGQHIATGPADLRQAIQAGEVEASPSN